MSRTDRVGFTPAQRSLRARLAAYKSWANTTDATVRTEPARRAAMSRFERQVDPGGVLPPEERARRGRAAMRAYFTELSLRSSRARAKRAARTEAEQGRTPSAQNRGEDLGEVR
jgi:hypothetical protein